MTSLPADPPEKTLTATKVGSIRRRYDLYVSEKDVSNKNDRADIVINHLIMRLYEPSFDDNNNYKVFNNIYLTYPNNHIITYMNQKANGAESLYLKAQKVYSDRLAHIDDMENNTKPIVEELKTGDRIMSEDEAVYVVISVDMRVGEVIVKKGKSKKEEILRFNDDSKWETYPEDDDADEDRFRETKKYIVFDTMFK